MAGSSETPKEVFKRSERPTVGIEWEVALINPESSRTTRFIAVGVGGTPVFRFPHQPGEREDDLRRDHRTHPVLG